MPDKRIKVGNDWYEHYGERYYKLDFLPGLSTYIRRGAGMSEDEFQDIQRQYNERRKFGPLGSNDGESTSRQRSQFRNG